MSSDKGFLSQDEIDALLNGGEESTPEAENKEVSSDTNIEETSENKVENQVENQAEAEVEVKAEVTDLEIDLLGEIGNISMGSASTALSTIIGNTVNITTPEVTVTTLSKLREEFEVPNIALEVKYTSGIVGGNLLVMKIPDAAVISNLMMGGDGNTEKSEVLSEIEESAVSEAMNQMIGSAATSMATMFAREVNISPPVSKIWTDNSMPLAEGIGENEEVIKVCFKLNIGNLVDSKIMQILPIRTAKKIVSIMMGQEEEEKAPVQEPQVQPQIPQQNIQPKPVETQYTAPQIQQPQPQMQMQQPQMQMQQPQMQMQQPVNVQQASFKPLEEVAVNGGTPHNIDLILDVPLEISVVLGKTKKSIKDILSLGTGSLIELDKLAEEPVEIYVNGKKVAYGEVVVVDENFGVRIVSIVSSEERIKSLKG